MRPPNNTYTVVFVATAAKAVDAAAAVNRRGENFRKRKKCMRAPCVSRVNFLFFSVDFFFLFFSAYFPLHLFSSKCVMVFADTNHNNTIIIIITALLRMATLALRLAFTFASPCICLCVCVNH